MIDRGQRRGERVPAGGQDRQHRPGRVAVGQRVVPFRSAGFGQPAHRHVQFAGRYPEWCHLALEQFPGPGVDARVTGQRQVRVLAVREKAEALAGLGDAERQAHLGAGLSAPLRQGALHPLQCADVGGGVAAVETDGLEATVDQVPFEPFQSAPGAQVDPPV